MSLPDARFRKKIEGCACVAIPLEISLVAVEILLHTITKVPTRVLTIFACLPFFRLDPFFLLCSQQPRQRRPVKNRDKGEQGKNLLVRRKNFFILRVNFRPGGLRLVVPSPSWPISDAGNGRTTLLPFGVKYCT